MHPLRRGGKDFLMPNLTQFASESVCAGHPDKVCDQISDAVLDAVLAADPKGRVAVEALAAHDHLVLAGEVTCEKSIDFEAIAREQVKQLGYTNPEWGFSHKSKVISYIHQQSPEIAVGVDQDGAGDQGLMFGFACKETTELMPLPITLAHQITRKIDTVRESKQISYLRPDGKAQVVVDYKDGKPIGISHITLAVPHDEEVVLPQVSKDLYEEVVAPVLGEYGFEVKKQNIVVNGTGVWHIPGPSSDCGLTGRKIVVDGYGGYARVGGGAFSGKDPSKVDRSGAYAARYLAKNIVAAGLAERVEVGVAFYIGAQQPVWLHIDAFGTAKSSDKVIRDFANQCLGLSVKQIIDTFDLRRPLYLKTATYGHFGRPEFPWEKIH